MPAQEIEHRAVSRRLADGRAQAVGRESGQIEEAPGALRVGKDPSKRTERDAGTIFN